MTEKVLGFRESDFQVFLDMVDGKIKLGKIQLRKVAVVSVEWLENYCKMQGYYDNNPFHDEDVVSVQDLLEAARKAVEKKE